ncbi:hypothetical protein Tco_0159898, partial [Tanacetum coccineum]
MKEAMALLDLAFCKRYSSSYETPSPSSPLLVRKRYRGTFELILDTNSEGDELGDEDTDEDEEDESLDADDKKERLDDEGHGLDDEDHGLDDEGHGLKGEGLTMGEPLGLGYGALCHRELAVEEDRVPSSFEVGQSSRSMLEQQGADRVSAFRQPTLTTWVDSKYGRVYIDIPV